MDVQAKPFWEAALLMDGNIDGRHTPVTAEPNMIHRLVIRRPFTKQASWILIFLLKVRKANGTKTKQNNQAPTFC